VWCESRSIAGVIVDLCEELAVSLYPAGGFSSISFAYEAAQYVEQDCGGFTWPWLDGEEPDDAGKGLYRQNKQAIVLYIGDYDPAGVLIDRSLEAELRQHLPEGFDLQFHRLAITEDQIAAFDLPTKPRRETDRRALHVKENGRSGGNAGEHPATDAAREDRVVPTFRRVAGRQNRGGERARRSEAMGRHAPPEHAMTAPRMVKLADLWQRKSAKGTVYFSGFMGDCQVLLPAEEVIVWKLLVQERDAQRRPQQRADPGQKDTGNPDRPFDNECPI
jgi:hypothetical protein